MAEKIHEACLPKRGEIWRVCFDPQVGAEICKTRPAVVISLDSIGKLPLRIIVPITEWQDGFRQCPWFVHLKPDKLNGLHKESGADAFQVKSVSLQRFVQRIGVLPEEIVTQISDGVCLCIGHQCG